MGSVHVPFGFYYEGTGTVAVYVRAESTSGTISAKVRGRAIKFGAEVASFDTSQFTASRTGITAGATSNSGEVDVSSISSGTAITLTGHSTAKVSVDNGTFKSAGSLDTIDSGMPFEVQLTASSTAGVSRSATVTIAGKSVTYTITTAGSYSGSYGGGGSGGGGFQDDTELR